MSWKATFYSFLALPCCAKLSPPTSRDIAANYRLRLAATSALALICVASTLFLFELNPSKERYAVAVAIMGFAALSGTLSVAIGSRISYGSRPASSVELHALSKAALGHARVEAYLANVASQRRQLAREEADMLFEALDGCVEDDCPCDPGLWL